MSVNMLLQGSRFARWAGFAAPGIRRVRVPVLRRLAALSFAPVFGLAHVAFAAVVTASPKTQPLGNVIVTLPIVTSFDLSSDTNNLGVYIVKDAANCATGVDMEITNPLAFPLALKSTNTVPVEVTFTPQARGAQSCQFNIMDGAGAGATLLETFSVTGTGVAPVAAVSLPALGYGDVPVGETKDLGFTLGNSTTDPGQSLTISSIMLTNISQYVFKAKPPDSTVLQPGTQQTVTVGFKPTTTGTIQGYVKISTNDPITPLLSVALTGTGTAPIINLPTDALIVDVVAGSSGSTNVSVGNVGNASLSVTGGTLTASGDWITLAGDPPGATCPYSKTCTFDSPLEIAAGSSANVAVQCTPPPGASGAQSETLTFASNTYPGPEKHTIVTCTVNDVVFADAFEGP